MEKKRPAREQSRPLRCVPATTSRIPLPLSSPYLISALAALWRIDTSGRPESRAGGPSSAAPDRPSQRLPTWLEAEATRGMRFEKILRQAEGRGRRLRRTNPNECARQFHDGRPESRSTRHRGTPLLTDLPVGPIVGLGRSAGARVAVALAQASCRPSSVVKLTRYR